MSWQNAGNGEGYLRRRVGKVDKGLGRRSAETEAIKLAFDEAKSRVKQTLAGTSARLNEMAPVNRALRLGRVPPITAKIIRKLDEFGALGRNIVIVGTNALYAYEIRAGVHLRADHLATGDIDFLFDARARIGLSINNLKAEGVIGLLRKVDRSFELSRESSFTAVNSRGFMVDLIMPHPKDPMAAARRESFPHIQGDLSPIEIDGLSWLVNSPKFEAIAVGGDGFPVRIVTPDPRAYALHKFWLSKRPDREPVKAKRDMVQAAIVTKLVIERFPQLPFVKSELTALPHGLFDDALLPGGLFDNVRDDGSGSLSPDW